MAAEPTSDVPVIVTRQEVESILVRQGAESAIHQTAEKASEIERAQAMAMTGAILRELRRAEVEHGSPGVLIAPEHGPASRLQSLIASGEAGTLSLQQMPSGGLEAKFDTGDWGGWSTVAWTKLKYPIPYPMIRPANLGPSPFPDQARIGVLGDWGTGLYGAPKIADTIMKEQDPYALLLHLGDVYYAGSKKEVQDRFLNMWPRRPEAIHRALNSNHEMYSGGEFYFTLTLPAFQQEASYFALAKGPPHARWRADVVADVRTERARLLESPEKRQPVPKSPRQQ